MAQILLVDDDNLVRETFSQLLSVNGHHVETANDGDQALDLLGASSPDVIITDMRMPRMDGAELMKKIPDGDGFFPGKILFTAHDDAEGIKLASEESGGVIRVEKGRWETDLMPAISRAIEYNRMRRLLWEQKIRCGSLASELEMLAKFEEEYERFWTLLEEDISLARDIQRHYLQPRKEAAEVMQTAQTAFYTRIQSATHITGDFFLPKEIAPGKAGLFLADVCGHGMAAALISIRILNIAESLRSPTFHPSEFLEAIHNDFRGLLPPTHFVAGLYIILSSEGEGIIANAGQPAPLLWRNGKMEELAKNGAPLGQLSGALRFTEETFQWEPGDRLLLFTDGLSETCNPQGELYGERRLYEIFAAAMALPSAEGALQMIRDDLAAFAENKLPSDDITILLLERIEWGYQRHRSKGN